MRRQDRELNQESCEAILQSATYGILSCVDDEGKPYAVPLNYVYDRGKLYFHHTNNESRLGQIVQAYPDVLFTVVGKSEVDGEHFRMRYASVNVFGKLKEYEDKTYPLNLLVTKYSPDFIEAGKTYIVKAADHVSVYEMSVREMTGKGTKE